MTGRFWAKKLRCRRSYYEIVNVLQQTQQRCHNRELEILAPIVLTPKKQNKGLATTCKELKWNAQDVTKHEMYFRVINTFLNSQKTKVLRRAAPVNVTRSLADIFVCQSLPDFRFSSRLIFMCQSPPPWHISALGSGPWWEERGAKTILPKYNFSPQSRISCP